MPAAEVTIDEAPVRALIAAQFPEWADRPATCVDAPGWDNAIVRLGDDLVARLPRRAFAAELVAKEQLWLPALATRLPVPVPVPIGCGVPADLEMLARLWDEALAAPPWPGPDVWVHGDLHPANLLVEAGRLSAVLDFGDLCVGDPATDLVSGWMLFDGPAREAFRRASGTDDATWARGRGWAVSISLACLASSADNPVIAMVGRRGIDALLAGRRSNS